MDIYIGKNKIYKKGDNVLMYYIYNDGEFAKEIGNGVPCLCCDNIISFNKAKRILTLLRKKYDNYDEDSFYIVKDNDIVKQRLEEGENLINIFTKNINLIYY